jgi:hypothetical protein
MSSASEPFRAVRLAYELRIQASAQQIFEVMTQQVLEWFPHTYGGDRVRRVVLEPRVGGQHYEDWGEDRGYLYGQVTAFDPPSRWATRGRLSPGTILDTEYELTEEPGAVRVRVMKVAVGPITEEEAKGSPSTATSEATLPPSRHSPQAETWAHDQGQRTSQHRKLTTPASARPSRNPASPRPLGPHLPAV